MKKNKNSKADVVSFWRKFGRMLGSGVPALEVLKIIEKETANQGLARAIRGVSQGIACGKSAFEAMSTFPEFFPESVTALVAVAEEAGNLDISAAKIANAIEKDELAVGGKQFGKNLGEVVLGMDDPVVKRLNLLLVKAVEKKASDLHFEPYWDEKAGGAAFRVRIRVDSFMTDLEQCSERDYKHMVGRMKVMGALDMAERKLPQDGRIMLKIKGRDIDLRVSTIPTMLGERLTARILDRENLKFDIDWIHFSDENRKTIAKWLAADHGLIIVSGPTGSGKTTTLYSMLGHLGKKGNMIIFSIEEPVEFILPGMTQIHVNQSIGLNTPRILRSVLRQDPDAVAVGEVRDTDTGNLLLQTAHTGHLVMTCLHARGGPDAVALMSEVVSAPFILGQTLLGSLGQLLVRRLCPKCREKYEPSKQLRDKLGLPALHKGTFYRAKGCKECFHGYRGMVAIHEVFENSEELRGLLSQKRNKEEFRKLAAKQGMKTFLEDGIGKAAAGLTSIEEVLRVTDAK